MALLPHEIDKHLVASSIHLTRIQTALDQIDLRTVPRERRDHIKEIRETTAALIKKMEIARTGSENPRRRAL